MSDYEAVRIGIENTFGIAGSLASEAVQILLNEWSRPSVLFRPEVEQDEDGRWRAVYCGITGMGDTPALACEAFDREWVKPSPPEVRP